MKNYRLLGYSIPLIPISLTLQGATLWPEMELLVPSLPAMKAFFNVTDGEIQQLLTANFIGFLAGVLLAGPLCDALGRKRVVLGGTIFFLVASALAAVAQSFSMMMWARLLQGITVTAPIIGGLTMLLEHTAGVRQIFWMSISSACITFCMAVAPLVGAFINSSFGFRGNLWAIFIAALLGSIPLALWVPETLLPEKRILLQPKTIANGYWELLKNPRFMGLSLIMGGLAGAYWVYTGVSALYMVDYLGMDPTLFGRYQGPIVGTFAFFSMAISWIHKKLSVKALLCLGSVLMAVGTVSLLVLALLGIEDAFLTTVFMMAFAAGIVPSNSLLFPSAINQLPQHLQGSGQSLIQALRLVLASVGTVFLGFYYKGPFLPVALFLAGMLLFCTLLLGKTWKLIQNTPSSGISGGH